MCGHTSILWDKKKEDSRALWQRQRDGGREREGERGRETEVERGVERNRER
jgi:hypothetical protein